MSDNRILVRELFFGKTDAYNELLECGAEEYEKLFWKNTSYSIGDFLNGKKYYIYGEKGTGKTAFLKYLECQLADSYNNLVIPIRYKSEFDLEEKKNLQRSINQNNIQEEIADVESAPELKDCINTWQLFLISKVIKALKKNESYYIFTRDKEYETLEKLLDSIYSDQSTRIVPRITKGCIDINLSSLKGLSAAIELEIGLEKDQKRVNYQQVAKKIIEVFQTLQVCNSNNNNIWILFDELELSVQSKKANKRDIQLVRDLILAIERLNGICRKLYFPIHIIASIRSEVINSVYTSGYEINKPIEDFGKEITWYIRGGSYKDSPLIAMIIQKLRVNEEKKGINQTDNLWSKYFPETINNMSSQEYILRYTWHRPRDVVRMLNIAKENSGDSYCFTQDIFDASMRTYSQKSWNEISEELSLIYDADDLKAIKKLLTNINVPFTYSDLKTRLDNLEEMHDCVKHFNQRHRLNNVLEQLFNAGVVGNSGQRMRFKFLKDDELDLAGKMIIHVPLRNYFAVHSNKTE